MKPIDGPKISGNTHHYATFCNDYKRIMMPVFGREAFHLGASLERDAAEVVVGTEDDFDEMMKCLDHAYSNPAKLTDCIIGEIRN